MQHSFLFLPLLLALISPLLLPHFLLSFSFPLFLRRMLLLNLCTSPFLLLLPPITPSSSSAAFLPDLFFPQENGWKKVLSSSAFSPREWASSEDNYVSCSFFPCLFSPLIPSSFLLPRRETSWLWHPPFHHRADKQDRQKKPRTLEMMIIDSVGQNRF